MTSSYVQADIYFSPQWTEITNMCRNKTLSFNLRVFTSKSGCVGITTHFIN